MSIEKLIADNTAALNRVADALEAGGTAKPAGKPAAGKATGSKPASKPAAKKNDGPTVDELAEKFGTYMKAGDKDERATAKANVMKIVAHLETDRITNLDPSKFAEALDLLAQYQQGEDPLGEEEDDGSDLM